MTKEFCPVGPSRLGGVGDGKAGHLHLEGKEMAFPLQDVRRSEQGRVEDLSQCLLHCSEDLIHKGHDPLGKLPLLLE